MNNDKGFCPKIGNKPQKNKIPVAHKATTRLYDGIIISINYSA